jgi:hypothetical protein
MNDCHRAGASSGHGDAMKRFTSAAAILAISVLPLAAYADTPSPAAPSGNQIIQGVIRSIDSKDAFTVRTGQGQVDNVTALAGTIVTPRGLALQPGMRVAIGGHMDGDRFEADRITGSPFTENTSTSTGESTPTLWPDIIPNGSFQTTGPSAAGGG